MTTDYQNISCSFYDSLVLCYTRKKMVEIQYLTDKKTMVIKDYIIDIYSYKKAEYLKTKQGITIRLDLLLEVDGQRDNEGSCSI